MDWTDYNGVERVPGRLGGQPVLRGTRVPADLIAECLDGGETPHEITYNYTLKLQDVLNFKAYRDTHQAASGGAESTCRT